MKRLITIILLAFCCLSCKPDRQQNVSNEMVINGLSAEQWTYFSFESGTVVGTSAFGDEEADESWKSRRDWDFAICGEIIKTNSGTSGDGLGGVQINTESSFNAITTAPSEGYLIDTLFIFR